MGSLTRPRRGLRVGPSPLNEVKLELALILFGAMVVMVIHPRLFGGWMGQLFLLAGYGVAGAVWLALRTRAVARRARRAGQGEP